jgi:fructose-bisphosphate aldolase class II
METKTKLENELKEAMKAGDEVKKRTVRMALAAIRQTEVDRQITVDEASVLGILQKEIKTRKEALEEARTANRPDLVAAAEEADVQAAIAGGFLDVMFDASRSSLAENVGRTREVVAYAHAHGVSVEAAFGAIGREGASAEGKELTDPGLAARFVEETGVDLLTPSVGNRHGCRGFTVPLDWDLMKELRARIPVPMVLHGGSGIAVEDMSQAGGLGFHKVNVATVLHGAYNGAVKGYIQEHPEHGWFRWTQAGREAVRSVVERYVTGLGLRGLAGPTKAP